MKNKFELHPRKIVFRSTGDTMVSDESRTLNIDPDILNQINEAVRPNVLSTPPKGYYSANELAKITKISKSQLLRRVRALKKENKVETVLCLVATKKGSLSTPYYKFLATPKKPIKKSL